MKWAVIRNGIVENKILADQAFINHLKTQPGIEEVVQLNPRDVEPKLGWRRRGKTFEDPKQDKKKEDVADVVNVEAVSADVAEIQNEETKG